MDNSTQSVTANGTAKPQATDSHEKTNQSKSTAEVETADDASNKVHTAYKRVDRKVKPVPAVFPEEAKVTRTFPEDPLATLKPLLKCPPTVHP